jgi:hypothetical protein
MFIEYPKMLYHPITKKGQVVNNRNAEDALLAEWRAVEKPKVPVEPLMAPEVAKAADEPVKAEPKRRGRPPKAKA